MKRWWRLASLIGICCSSLCFLALPLLLLWLPATGFGWLHNEALTRGMLLMFLAMFLAGSVNGFKHHRRPTPLILASSGAVLLISTAWQLLPFWIGWLALAALIAAWLHDKNLMQGMHHEHPLRGHE